MDISLEGKVAIVTEVGLNIGSGIALAFARYGAKVACTYFDLDAAKAAADCNFATNSVRVKPWSYLPVADTVVGSVPSIPLGVTELDD